MTEHSQPVSDHPTPRWVVIPTTPEAWIPLGLPPEDYDLLLATIEMWKHRIIMSQPEALNDAQ